jgi:thiosulfate reductase cytochrome b subunit
MTERMVRVYPLFERFWHWSQAGLIFLLLFTGMGLRGLHGAIGFETAVALHVGAALALMALWVFAVFWHLTTGAWRHYMPTANGLPQVARFYAWGIFRGERHPYRKAYWRKHNPLQALSYLALKLMLFPAVWISGLLYLGYNLWEDWALAGDAFVIVQSVHALAAYAIAAFVIAHVYLLTTGHSFAEHVRPMITGWDHVELTPAEEAYLRADEPDKLEA